MQETLIPSLGQEDQEDTMEEEMTTHSSILAWEIPWMGSLVAYSPRGQQRVRCQLATQQQSQRIAILMKTTRDIS